MSGPIQRELTRRGLLIAGGAAAASLAQAAALTQGAAAALKLRPSSLLPTQQEVRRSIAAYVDTIVPGPAGGADSAPGGLEAGALEVVYDPAYGANIVLPVLHEDLQVTALRMTGSSFDLALPYAQRERIVVDRLKSTGKYGLLEGDLPFILLYAGVAIIAYVAYYGTARSDLGPRYIGLPVSADGYSDHSYGVAFKTMTADGNPR